MADRGGTTLDDLLAGTQQDLHADGGQQPPALAPHSARGGRRRPLIVLTVLVLLLGLVAGGVGLYVHQVSQALDDNIERLGDPFDALPQDVRPPVDAAAADALNILMVGTDSRISAGDPTQWTAGAQRTDAIMVLHLPSDRSGATVISIPRDSWVDVPGRGMNKINAAFSLGGPPLMIQAVEQYTGVRIDHFVILDFDGFVEITDALDGVRIKVPRSTGDKRGSFPAGTYTMDGATALNYVRQRQNLPGGDFGRIRRQQNWLRAVAKEMLPRASISNPGQLTDSLDALSRSVATDDAFTIGEMRGLLLASSTMRARDLDFFTVPVEGAGRSPDKQQSIVVLDEQANDSLWKAVAADDVDRWIADNDPNLLGEIVD